MPLRDFIDIHAFTLPTNSRALFVFCDVCAGSAATNANTPQNLRGVANDALRRAPSASERETCARCFEKHV